jgi:hypothetical protein
MVRGGKTGGRHATSENSIHCKLQFWSIQIIFQACLDHISSTFQERACCVTQFQNSCLDHISSMFGSHFKHISSTFGSDFKHVSRSSMMCYLVSKFMCADQISSNSGACLDHISSTFGSHFKHIWITFQACFKNKHAVLPSFKIHVPITI